MPDNLCYRRGAVWVTRMDIKAFLDKDEWTNSYQHTTIPRGEHVLLLAYYMSRNFEEHATILWNDGVYFVHNIDTALQFNTDPKGYNTENEREVS